MHSADSLILAADMPSDNQQDCKWTFYRICNQLVAEHLSSGLEVEVDRAIEMLHQGNEDWSW